MLQAAMPALQTDQCFVFSFPKGSVPSLAAGLLFGGLAGLGAYQQSQDPKNVWLSLSKLFCFVFKYNHLFELDGVNFVCLKYMMKRV